MQQREVRALAAPIEVRADSRTATGYAAVYNSIADIGGYFNEQIAPGAFDGTLDGDIRALFNHDTAHVLGRTIAGTLRLASDDRGLAVEIDMPDTAMARDLTVSMTRGDISGMSFGFNVTKQTWDESGPVILRTIEAVELFEVSIVTFPAYDATDVAVRSLEQYKREQRTHNFNAAARRLKMKTAIRLASKAQG